MMYSLRFFWQQGTENPILAIFGLKRIWGVLLKLNPPEGTGEIYTAGIYTPLMWQPTQIAFLTSIQSPEPCQK